MYPSKHPILFMLHTLAVAVAIVATLLITENALALIGLMFLPAINIVPPPVNNAGEERAPAMGFLSHDSSADTLDLNQNSPYHKYP